MSWQSCSRWRDPPHRRRPRMIPGPCPAGRPGARLYSVALPKPNWRVVPDQTQREQLQTQDQEWRHDGLGLGISPVVDRGELFFQDNARVYALSLDTGTPLPDWMATYPSQNGQYVIKDAWNLPTGHPCALSLTDTAVLAVMDQPDFLAGMYRMVPGRDATLVCLDRQTGKEN